MDIYIKPRKRKMPDDVEMEYYEFLRSITEDSKKGLMQASILKKVNEEVRFSKYNIKQSELSKDLKHAQLVAVKEQGVMVYRHKTFDPSDDMPVEFHNYVSGTATLFNKPKCLKIPVDEGSEMIVCKKIHNHFKSSNIICIPAYRAVCVIASSTDNSIKKVKDIQEKINAIYNFSNK